MIGPVNFQEPLYLSIILLAFTGVYILLRSSELEDRILGLSRVFFFILLAIALAGPFVEDVSTVQEDRELYYLQDKSRSMEVLNNVSVDIEGVNQRERVILQGNNSNIASALDSALRENSSYLLMTDGRASSGELDKVLKKYRRSNSTISVLEPDTKQASSVYVSGPSSTVPGATTEFKVHPGIASEEDIMVEVKIDNETVLQRKIRHPATFNRTFDSVGSHRIKATTEMEGVFSENDAYYKYVKVREKPEVLYIGSEGGLTEKLSKFYELDIREDLPGDLSDYYAVISTRSLNDPEMTSYISKGNGYMHVAGYQDAPEYIPLERSSEDYESKSTRVAMAMESSEWDSSATLRDSKEVALGLVSALPGNTKFAGIYYAEDVFPFVQGTEGLNTLRDTRARIQENIRRFERSPEKRHEKAIRKASELLEDEGNIVLLTNGGLFDGGERGQTPEETRSKAFSAAENLPSDINLYVVRTGRSLDQADSAEEERQIEDRKEFLKELVDRASGPRSKYYSSDRIGNLALEFGAGGGASSFKPLLILDEDHFITEGLYLDSEVSEFDNVRPKTSSNVLVSGPEKREFLTVWRYGLGRVSAFSGGQPTLSRVLSRDPGLVSRTVSWTVGDPKRKIDEWVEVEENQAPGEVEITASYPIEELTYSSKNRFTGSISPGYLGFHNFSGNVYGYNYNSEIREVGVDHEVNEKIASETGGRVYTPRELEQADLSGEVEKEVTKRRSLSALFLLAAMVVFLGEVGYRKLKGRR